jgi:hypothetical protein
MRSDRGIRYCLLVVLSSGCAGTLDEASFYESRSPVSLGALDAASPADRDEPQDGEDLDAGSAPLDAGARDARALDEAATPWQGDSALTDAWLADGWATTAHDGASADAEAIDAAPVARDAGDAAAPDAGACDFRALISAKCGNSGCHGAPASGSGLDLTSDNLAARLAGKMASSACASYLLIDGENPAQSALYLKVTKDACGSRMPLGGTLTDQEQSCILQWITQL